MYTVLLKKHSKNAAIFAVGFASGGKLGVRAVSGGLPDADPVCPIREILDKWDGVCYNKSLGACYSGWPVHSK